MRSLTWPVTKLYIPGRFSEYKLYLRKMVSYLNPSFYLNFSPGKIKLTSDKHLQFLSQKSVPWAAV
jgi:hypothetical protein